MEFSPKMTLTIIWFSENQNGVFVQFFQRLIFHSFVLSQSLHDFHQQTLVVEPLVTEKKTSYSPDKKITAFLCAKKKIVTHLVRL